MNTAAKEFIPKVKPVANMYPAMGPIAFIDPYYAAVPMYIDPNLPMPIYPPPTATNSYPNEQIANEEEEFEEEDEPSNSPHENFGQITYVKKIKEETKEVIKEDKKEEVKKVEPVVVQEQSEKKEPEKATSPPEIIPKEKQPESKYLKSLTL